MKRCVGDLAHWIHLKTKALLSQLDNASITYRQLTLHLVTYKNHANDSRWAMFCLEDNNPSLIKVSNLTIEVISKESPGFNLHYNQQ